ncbi:hypothetical protein C5468_20490 [Photorhabdus luminescens subsp. mexicana]|uniref:Uncharacterized protein n=1 Tax=Photorhabdus luminescens subsp. mexicana TaxID=2100167 RepID=A0A4R4IXE6_PHOLU|nr:hypothetical protein C5468_20490 [Photorhabdus luminescens subsp. mexicana]
MVTLWKLQSSASHWLGFRQSKQMCEITFMKTIEQVMNNDVYKQRRRATKRGHFPGVLDD